MLTLYRVSQELTGVYWPGNLDSIDWLAVLKPVLAYLDHSEMGVI